MTDADKSKSNPTGAFGMRGADLEKLLLHHRKNIEAIMRANEYALDGIHAAWGHHIASVNQIVESYAALLDEAALAGPLRDRFTKYSDFSRQILEKNAANGRDVTILLASAANRALGVLARCFVDGLDEAGAGADVAVPNAKSTSGNVTKR
jgi:hypothetical protein